MQRTRNSLIIIVATCFLFLARSTICDESANKNNSAPATVEKTKPQENAVVNVTKDVIKHNQNNNNNNATTEQQTGKNITSKSASTISGDKTVIEHHLISEPASEGHSPTVNSGALLRGFYIFTGLGVLGLAYMVFRSFGSNKQRPQMVRKYGILAHRQDIEMRPLPLDEDDDDDTTVFDVSGLASSRAQS